MIIKKTIHDTIHDIHDFLYLFITLILVYKILCFWKSKWRRYNTFFGTLHVMQASTLGN